MNKKEKGFGIIICFLLLLSFTAENVFATIEFLNGKVSIFGRMEFLGGVRTHDGYASNFRFTFQPEVNWKIIDAEDMKLSLYMIPRLFYEGAADVTDHWGGHVWRQELQDPKGEEWLREVYIDVKKGRWGLRLGKQQIIWGESDGIRMADIINPLDLSWHYNTEPWEDIRRPMWMANLNYQIPGPGSLNAEVVWIPTDFLNTRLAPASGNWAIPGLNQFFLDLIDASDPLHHRTLNNSEFGVRLRGIAGPFDWSIFQFHARADGSVFHLGSFINYLTGTGSIDEIFRYQWTENIGGTFNFYEQNTEAVFRGECVFINNDPFNNATLTKIFQKNTFAYMLGFDRPTRIDVLNTYSSFFFSFQLFQKWILNWDDDDQIRTTTQDDRKYQTILTLFISTDYYDVVLPKVLFVVDLGGNGWVNPEVTFKRGTQIRFKLGANVFYGERGRQTYFDPISHNHEVYSRLEYWF